MKLFSETKTELLVLLQEMKAEEFATCLAALDRGEFGPSDLSAAELAKFRAILSAFQAALFEGAA